MFKPVLRFLSVFLTFLALVMFLMVPPVEAGSKHHRSSKKESHQTSSHKSSKHKHKVHQKYKDLKKYKRPDLDQANKSGEIRGSFQTCANDSSGIIVYVVGRSFSALLTPDGQFTLSYVPPGTYSLAFVQNNHVLTTVEDIQVRKHKLTDLSEIAFCPDNDNDGYDQSQDCNDNNPNVHPGATEVCDSLDNDCNGSVDDVPGGCLECTDADQDGFFAQEACVGPVDCNDNDPTVSPSAQEVCFDSVDNNCDDQVDENCGCPSGTEDCDGNGTCETDLNSDPNNCGACGTLCGSGGSCSGGVCIGGQACSDQEVSLFQSCIVSCDTALDPLSCTTGCLANISSVDCIGAIQGLSLCALQAGCSTQPSDLFSLCAFQNCPDEWAGVFGSGSFECPPGTTNCSGQCVDLQFDSNNCGQCGSACGQNQVCINGFCQLSCAPGLSNCNGQCVDLNTDPNHCGSCNSACSSGTCTAGACEAVDNDMDGVAVPLDCNDNDPDVFPGNVEVCDNKDNNCNGAVDEGLFTQTFYVDSDADGFGSPIDSVTSCAGAPPGYVANDIDCNDANPDTNPNASEICDGIDNNCDGQTDESDPNVGSACSTGQQGICGAGTTVCSAGALTCAQTQPPIQEVCGDSLDNNCDGQVDEGCP